MQLVLLLLLLLVYPCYGTQHGAFPFLHSVREFFGLQVEQTERPLAPETALQPEKACFSAYDW